jgi:hypothetical protein
MRKRFEPQLKIGQRPIEETPVAKKNRDGLTHLVLALRTLYASPEYRDKVFDILEDVILYDKQKTGRMGMNLWEIFVLSQVRLCSHMSYDQLHNTANFNSQIRQLMGVELEWGFERIEFSYQSVIDNVSLLDDATVRRLNDVIVEFGHGEVFKKKEAEALRLKTDSFVVESNVHFPTDYNLLWDCCRKTLDVAAYFSRKYPKNVTGWRKLKYWRRTLKGQMRLLGKTCASGGSKKEVRKVDQAADYVHTARLLQEKLQGECGQFPVADPTDMIQMITLENYLRLLIKHIDLVERRLIKGESIPHHEKMFSVFETYTEWISKGKQRPSVELGKNLSVTTDQYQLIVDYQIMENQTDSQILLQIADRVLSRYQARSWSFDRGYWNADNKAILELYVPKVVMSKKGKLSMAEKEVENQPAIKRLRNGHSAVESNIHALETRGLDRCPDRGYSHFKRYIGLAVCACNLCCIGRALMATQKQPLKEAA